MEKGKCQARCLQGSSAKESSSGPRSNERQRVRETLSPPSTSTDSSTPVSSIIRKCVDLQQFWMISLRPTDNLWSLFTLPKRINTLHGLVMTPTTIDRGRRNHNCGFTSSKIIERDWNYEENRDPCRAIALLQGVTRVPLPFRPGLAEIFQQALGLG